MAARDASAAQFQNITAAMAAMHFALHPAANIPAKAGEVAKMKN
jgi:hypothetical protein